MIVVTSQNTYVCHTDEEVQAVLASLARVGDLTPQVNAATRTITVTVTQTFEVT